MRISDWSSDVCSSDLICCTAGQEEADRILAHCRDRGIDASGLTFEIGSSSATLPPLEASGTERDLVLINGSHAFPLPMVDWFYGASLLVAGGTLVVDDVNLPAVRVLKRFLDQDRSEEHTSELQSLMRISYAIFCLKK